MTWNIFAIQLWERDWNQFYSLRNQPSLLIHRRSPGGTPAPQRQKFHTDDVNQCLHNKPGSLGVPKENLLVHMFLLVDYGKVLCSSANELHQNSNASAKEEFDIFHEH